MALGVPNRRRRPLEAAGATLFRDLDRCPLEVNDVGAG